MTQPKRILVVDDEVKMLRVLELQLQTAGFQVTKAEAAEIGLKLFDAAVDRSAFEARWTERLSVPTAIPRASGWIEVEPEEGPLRTVRWGVRFGGAVPTGALCSVLHAPPGPFDEVMLADELAREEVPCELLAEDGERLVGRYSAPGRVLLAIELEVPDGKVRLLAERRELD